MSASKQSKSKRHQGTARGIRRARPAPLVLEQRLMFDGAAIVETVVAATSPSRESVVDAAPDAAAPMVLAPAAVDRKSTRLNSSH